MTKTLDEGYVYLDFLKAPKQPDGYEDYIPQVDLITELNAIKRTDRTFYDFYRDIENILERTRDGHFSMYARVSPSNFPLNQSYFCIPYTYTLSEVKNEQGEVTTAFLTIEPRNACKEGYSSDVLAKIDEMKGKKNFRNK
jgi:hypothetical protein